VIHGRQKRRRDAVALLGSAESDGLSSLREHGRESSAVRLARASRWVRISIWRALTRAWHLPSSRCHIRLPVQ